MSPTLWMVSPTSGIQHAVGTGFPLKCELAGTRLMCGWVMLPATNPPEKYGRPKGSVRDESKRGKLCVTCLAFLKAQERTEKALALSSTGCG